MSECGMFLPHALIRPAAAQEKKREDTRWPPPVVCSAQVREHDHQKEAKRNSAAI